MGGFGFLKGVDTGDEVFFSGVPIIFWVDLLDSFGSSLIGRNLGDCPLSLRDANGLLEATLLGSALPSMIL